MKKYFLINLLMPIISVIIGYFIIKTDINNIIKIILIFGPILLGYITLLIGLIKYKTKAFIILFIIETILLIALIILIVALVSMFAAIIKAIVGGIVSNIIL